MIVAVLLAASLASCKSQYDILLEGNDVDAKYKAAFSYFWSKKYVKAGQLFESLATLTSGTERDDTVQYYWGLSNYRQKDYVTAETNFDHFLQNFPGSAFANDARFLRLDCLYRATNRYELDQSPTYKAITAISEYKIDNMGTPEAAVCDRMLDDLSERLDRKAYENARLYYKMEDYKAARVALRNVLKDNSENRYREEILYYTAMASYKYAELSVPEKQKERYLVFVDDYLNFIGEYPESAFLKDLDPLYAKARKK